MDEYVLRGNAAIIKCHIPSFVADYVFVSGWLEDENNVIAPSNTGDSYGTRDIYYHCFNLISIELKTDREKTVWGIKNPPCQIYFN